MIDLYSVKPIDSATLVKAAKETAHLIVVEDLKLKDAKTSVALYSVSSDVDGAKIMQRMQGRSDKAIVRMLTTASEPLTTDPQLVASMLQGAMSGVSRRMLESGGAEKQVDILRRELIIVACAYVDACSAQASVKEKAQLLRPA